MGLILYSVKFKTIAWSKYICRGHYMANDNQRMSIGGAYIKSSV